MNKLLTRGRKIWILTLANHFFWQTSAILELAHESAGKWKYDLMIGPDSMKYIRNLMTKWKPTQNAGVLVHFPENHISSGGCRKEVLWVAMITRLPGFLAFLANKSPPSPDAHILQRRPRLAQIFLDLPREKIRISEINIEGWKKRLSVWRMSIWTMGP